MKIASPFGRGRFPNHSKKERLGPSERQKKTKQNADLTRGGNSDCIAQYSIITVFTVLEGAGFGGEIEKKGFGYDIIIIMH